VPESSAGDFLSGTNGAFRRRDRRATSADKKTGDEMSRTRKNWTVVILGTLLLPLLIWAVDNPLKNAKVGEHIEFSMITETMGTKMEMKMKQTVIAKDEVSVTLRTVSTAMGKEMPPQDSKIMLNQPYEPYKTGFTDAVVTPLGDGNETITVGGKSYACHWVKVKIVATKPMAVNSTTTVWSCKDVPVSGMVRMVTDSTMKMGEKDMTTKMTMELVSAGK
jgi:hypothetical protein